MHKIDVILTPPDVYTIAQFWELKMLLQKTSDQEETVKLGLAFSFLLNL